MLIVRLYKEIPIEQKPVGIPDDWPAEVATVDGLLDVPSGWIVMSEGELDSHKAKNLASYLAWKEALSLPSIKEEKFAAIDKRTSQMIGEGFTFAGKVFSLSLNAQSTHGGLYMIREEPGLVFPVIVNTIDNLDTYGLSSASEIRDFYLSGVACYHKHLDSGTTLKNVVRSASTILEVAAVTDTR